MSLRVRAIALIAAILSATAVAIVLLLRTIM
jgi:hypothetical protein